MIQAAYTMHQGKPINQQDALLVGGKVYQSANLAVKSWQSADDAFMLAVADGLGNHQKSQVASRFVLAQLQESLNAHPDWINMQHAHRFITKRHLFWIQAQLAKKYADKPTTHGAACTLALMHIIGKQALVLNAGDSRIYRINETLGLQPLSQDHTILQTMIDEGDADPDQEYSDIYKMLNSAIVADTYESEFNIHQSVIHLHAGDGYFICTDGVHDILPHEELESILLVRTSLAEKITACRKAVLKRGAEDNFSMVLMA